MANKEELRKEGINFLNYVCKKIKETGELPFDDEEFDHYYLKATKDPTKMTSDEFDDFSITNYYFYIGLYLDILDSDYNKYILDFERRSLKLGTILYNICIKEYSIFNSNLKQSMIDIFKRIKEIPKDEENAKKYIQNLREDIEIKNNFISFDVGLKNIEKQKKEKDTVSFLLNDKETKNNFIDLCAITLKNIAYLKAINEVRDILIREFNLKDIKKLEKPTELTTFQTTKKGIEELYEVSITENPEDLKNSEIGKYLTDFTQIEKIDISAKQKKKIEEQIKKDKEKYIANLIFENPEKDLYHYRLASELIKEMRW